MTRANDSATPTSWTNYHGVRYSEPGITKLEYMALELMKEELRNTGREIPVAANRAATAAKALIEALNE